jgi:hypothetical protein
VLVQIANPSVPLRTKNSSPCAGKRLFGTFVGRFEIKKEIPVKTMWLAISLLALTSQVASAQTKSFSSGSLPGASRVSQTHVQQNVSPNAPAGCSPCLWYSGDWDPSNPNANEQWNSFEPFNHNNKGQVFVPFVATPDGNALHKHVLISSITFNELVSGISDFTTMTYEVRTGVGNGIPGTVRNSGSCVNPSAVPTGRGFGGESEYSFTCSPKAPIKIAIGTIYWINTTPTFTVSNVAFLDDVEDTPAPNQFGWGDDLYNSFFYSLLFGVNFAPTWGASGSCNGKGCDEFSVAIAGTYID